MSNKFVIGILVSNHFGVLLKVVGLFSRRGFNIDSLTVGETEDKEFSRITIVSTGDKSVQTQIVHQLEKLYDVKKVSIMESELSVRRELLLIKLKINDGNRSGILETVNVFRAKVVDYSLDSMTVEVTGDHSKVQAFVEYMKQFEILEIARTGLTALDRSDSCLK